MKSFDFVVDTTPMANSVDRVSGHVQGTTAAVCAMEAAVIKTEQESTAKICENVTTGFHILIQSQISQKAAEFFSQMSSKMVLLMEFSKSLAQTQSRMNADYQRLKREYSRIFHGLDKALENRIRQLNKDAMQLGDIKKSIVTGRIIKEAPSALIYSKDTQNTAQLMFSARIKSKTSKALENMHQNVFGVQFYKKQVDSLLRESNIVENSEECVPIVFTEEKSTVSSDNNINNVFVSEGIENLAKTTIENHVMQNLTVCENQQVTDSEKSEIEKEFMKLVASSQLDERVTQQIVSLFKGEE